MGTVADLLLVEMELPGNEGHVVCGASRSGGSVGPHRRRRLLETKVICDRRGGELVAATRLGLTVMSVA